MHTSSEKFGLLLGHFMENDRAALSAPAAAGLSGFGVGAAREVLRLLENEGILRSRLRGGRRFYCAAKKSLAYWHYRWRARRGEGLVN